MRASRKCQGQFPPSSAEAAPDLEVRSKPFPRRPTFVVAQIRPPAELQRRPAHLERPEIGRLSGEVVVESRQRHTRVDHGIRGLEHRVGDDAFFRAEFWIMERLGFDDDCVFFFRIALRLGLYGEA